MMCCCKRIQPKKEEESHRFIFMEHRDMLQLLNLDLAHCLVWLAFDLCSCCCNYSGFFIPCFDGAYINIFASVLYNKILVFHNKNQI